MSAALIRIALMQFIVIIVSVLLSGITLKARFGSESHLPILATYVRDYGIFLLVLPAAWGIWGAVRNNRPLAGTGDAGLVFTSGMVLLAVLTVMGFLAFRSALTTNSIWIVVPAHPPVSATPKFDPR